MLAKQLLALHRHCLGSVVAKAYVRVGMAKTATKPKPVKDLPWPSPSQMLTVRKTVGVKGFQKGQVANPNGRPRNSRERLTASFMDELANSFDRHGRKALDKVATSDPSTYVRVIASLMPKEIRMDSGPLGGLSQQELDALAGAARKAVELAKAD